MDEKNHDELEEVVEDATEDTLEDTELEVVEDNQNKKIKSLQSKLKACETEKSAHLDELQRAKADFLNAKRRLEEEKKQSISRTENACIESLLPLYDSFAMAMENTEAWEATPENWRKGVESIHGQLLQLLKSYNVVSIGTIGDTFDPAVHEALSEEPVDEELVDTIVTVIQAGFSRTIGEKTELIRPARVVVGIKK